MGRGKTKAKKLTVTSHGNMGSGEEEKIPPQKRRGRPLKPLKDEIIEDDVNKMDDDDSENKDSSITENGKKRRRNSPTKEKQSPVKEENDSGVTLAPDVSTKPIGFRHIGSRRKNKPRRAAEVGVECW
ncbi:hypothetical protein KSS87_004415 [Heliosperma pusillum]|nr:hypothetical protein KSS87_004415 [Heliosperma pusillum]